MKLLLNEESRDHGKLLRSWLGGCDEGFIAVAFLKEAGLRVIREEITGFLQRGGHLRMIVGTDFFLTEPDALRWLLGRSREFPSLEWRMVAQSASSTFHPKYYRFSGGGQRWVMTGSANLTAGGLERNIEASALAEDRDDGDLGMESQRIEGALWANARCQEPTEERIGEYAVRYEATEERRREAEEAGARELEEGPRLTGEKLNAELREYQSNGEAQADRVERRTNYLRAKQLIEGEFLGESKVSQEVFDQVYGKLVGDGQGTKLWHSGGVFRSKSKVRAQKDKVVTLIRELAQDLSRTPEGMFKVRQEENGDVDGLGPNIFTEICNTLAPARFAVLNKNPLESLRVLGEDTFPKPLQFKPEDYGRFCRCMDRLRVRCGFSDLGETDHFLNFVYWRHRDHLKPEAKQSEEDDHD